MNDKLLRLADLVDNPTARVPVCLCLDTSSSMHGDPINELNNGVKLFYDAITEDETAMYSAEISIVTFGTKAKCEIEFSSLSLVPNPPVLEANGTTPMGEAVNMALDLLEERKKEYQDKDVDYFQPWLVLMTDGSPNGSEQELKRAIDRTVDMINSKKLTVFAIGIGNEADKNSLSRLSPRRAPAKLQGINFQEFFEWLSQSVSRTSQSVLGETVRLDKPPLDGWDIL